MQRVYFDATELFDGILYQLIYLASGLEDDSSQQQGSGYLQPSAQRSKRIPSIDWAEKAETVIPAPLKGTDRDSRLNLPLTANRRITLGGRRAGVIMPKHVDRRQLKLQGRLYESDGWTMMRFIALGGNNLRIFR